MEIEITHEIDERDCKRSKIGDTIHQFYTLKLEDGKVVDTNEGSGQPWVFALFFFVKSGLAVRSRVFFIFIFICVPCRPVA